MVSIRVISQQNCQAESNLNSGVVLRLMLKSNLCLLLMRAHTAWLREIAPHPPTPQAVVGDEIRMALKGYTGISSPGPGETGGNAPD
jgi:hypothetical protein